MVDTNALLSIGFAIVANFTNIVHVPPAEVPTTINDLQKYIVGSPNRPIDLSLQLKNGAYYWIFEGVVQGFESPGTYFQGQDFKNVAKYGGIPNLDSNQVRELATRTLESLAKTGNPVAGLSPRVRKAAPTSDGREIPFYLLTWPGRTNSPCDVAAEVEIDARTGQIVRLQLWDKGFLDLPYSRKIRDKVYKPEPKPKFEFPLPDRARFRFPTTNQVLAGIRGWVELCKRLELSPGGDTSLARVDWSRSYIYTNHAISDNVPVTQVWFKNGVSFEAERGVILSHFASDSCYVGYWDDRPAEEWSPFHGRVIKRWQDLACDLETKLVERIGLSRSILRSCPQELVYVVPEVGADGVVRCVVRWRDEAEDARLRGSGFEPFGAIRAEFDLQSGELKWIAIHNPTLLGWKGASSRD